MDHFGPFYVKNPVQNPVVLTKTVVWTPLIQYTFWQYCGNSLDVSMHAYYPSHNHWRMIMVLSTRLMKHQHLTVRTLGLHAREEMGK